MKTNFEIIENYGLNFKGFHVDLHHNFDYFNFDYNIEKEKLDYFLENTLENGFLKQK